MIYDFTKLTKFILLYNFIDYIGTKLGIYYWGIDMELNPYFKYIFSLNNIYIEIFFKFFIMLPFILLLEKLLFKEYNSFKGISLYNKTLIIIIVSVFVFINTIHLSNMLVIVIFEVFNLHL